MALTKEKNPIKFFFPYYDYTISSYEQTFRILLPSLVTRLHEIHVSTVPETTFDDLIIYRSTIFTDEEYVGVWIENESRFDYIFTNPILLFSCEGGYYIMGKIVFPSTATLPIKLKISMILEKVI